MAGRAALISVTNPEQALTSRTQGAADSGVQAESITVSAYRAVLWGSQGFREVKVA
jgi:hypothetical protein